MKKPKIFTLLFLLSLFCGTEAMSQWATSGSNIYNTNSGNVGVGTSSPDRTLTVNGSISIPKGQAMYFGNNGVGNGEQIRNIDFGLTFYTNFTRRMTVIHNGNVGIGYTSPAYKLDVNGTVRASSYLTASDKRFKSNIQPLNGSLEKLLKVEGVSYSFNHDKFKERSFPDKVKHGLIAQDVQKIFPEMVSQDDQGYYSIDYIELIPVMIEAIKELNKKVTFSLQGNIPSGKNTSVDEANITLFQNTPNPSNTNTKISYAIDKQVEYAALHIYTLNGEQIKKYDLTDSKGSVEVAAGELKPGIYLYAVTADGKESEVRRMIITQ